MSPRKPKLPPVGHYAIVIKGRSIFAVGVAARRSGRVRRGFEVIDTIKKQKLADRMKQEAEAIQREIREKVGSFSPHQWDEGDQGFTHEGLHYDADTEDPITAGRSSLRPRTQQRYQNWHGRKSLQQNWTRINEWLELALLSTMPLEDCQCLLQEARNVHLISLEGFKTISYRYCSCGKRCAKLLEQGLFPSAPIRPRFVFKTSFLEIFHGISMRAACSGQAFEESWRDLWEKEHLERLPSFHRELKNAYHHWRAVVSLASSTAFRSCSNGLEDHSLKNMCPSCFAFADIEKNEDKVVYIAMDGNMQHSRYKDTHEEYEEFPSRYVLLKLGNSRVL